MAACLQRQLCPHRCAGAAHYLLLLVQLWHGRLSAAVHLLSQPPHFSNPPVAPEAPKRG
jgi:hypothetical protein